MRLFELVLRACRPAWTGVFSDHQKTVYDWRRVIKGMVEGSSKCHMSGAENEKLLRYWWFLYAAQSDCLG